MNKVSYKDTLNLPKTEFSMKANLPQTEPKIEALWAEKKVYEKLQEKNSGREKFILHDGPPYANGDIHLGHALNKILKDIIIRYKSMKGYDTPFVPGWDCHGLPVETQLLKKLNLKKHQIEKVSFREKARDFALKFVEIQKEQFKRLGIFGEWDNPYLTLNKEYEAQILRALAGLIKENYIYRSLKPVNWCYHCETALAEAEVEYQDSVSPSVFVKFKIKQSKIEALDKTPGNDYLVVWTTTPWTLLANVACAVNPGLIYSLVKVGNETWIMAKVLIEKVLTAGGVKDYEVIAEIKADEFTGTVYGHPFFEREGVVVAADYVSAEDGSGIVHTAPGHGQEDFMTGVKYDLPIIMPVDEKGKFDSNQGEFSGLNVHEANNIIIEKLTGMNLLIKASKISHSYPHCWRCKNPIIFRATNQYFMKIDHDDLRKKLLSIVNNEVEWIPPQGKDRIQAMIENRPDWCLSRQRFWGIPIPALYCQNCKTNILDAAFVEHVAELVKKEGTNVWFEKSEKELVAANFCCPECKGSEFKKEEDILDVWFESGVSFRAVLEERSNLIFPSNIYLEGSDQHRGWFQSSLITSAALEKKAPYKQVLTHGFVVDGAGRKMSKSLGNVIMPEEIIKEKGADILRLWVASSDYNDDVRISDEIMSRLSDAYRKIRNTFRFILGNLYDFDINKDAIDYAQMRPIDKWALSKLGRLLSDVNTYYEKYEFLKVYQEIYHFCTVELSSFYLDILKDKLYTFAPKSIERKSAQTALFYIIETLVKITAPIIPFTAEEVYQYLTLDKKTESVHLLDWPQEIKFKSYENKDIEAEFEKLLLLRKDVTKKLEEFREGGSIGNSLEAKVTLYVKEGSENQALLEKYSQELAYIFIVSQIEIKAESSLKEGSPAQYFEGANLKIEKAVGGKCARCWNYAPGIGEDKDYPDICSRCLGALKVSK
ncbi:MAG: isoleucine--tRNA ligase [Candidatus Omnitrophota bacterium]